MSFTRCRQRVYVCNWKTDGQIGSSGAEQHYRPCMRYGSDVNNMSTYLASPSMTEKNTKIESRFRSQLPIYLTNQKYFWWLGASGGNSNVSSVYADSCIVYARCALTVSHCWSLRLIQIAMHVFNNNCGRSVICLCLSW